MYVPRKMSYPPMDVGDVIFIVSAHVTEKFNIEPVLLKKKVDIISKFGWVGIALWGKEI